MGDRAMSIREAAEFLGIEEATLRNWRSKRRGPPSYAISSRKIIYREKELRLWMEERKQNFEKDAS
jgi:predicted DNA-binding transcriptional regulator AlpA